MKLTSDEWVLVGGIVFAAICAAVALVAALAGIGALR